MLGIPDTVPKKVISIINKLRLIKKIRFINIEHKSKNMLQRKISIEARLKLINERKNEGLLPYKMYPGGLGLEIPYTENIKIILREINKFNLKNVVPVSINKKTLNCTQRLYRS